MVWGSFGIVHILSLLLGAGIIVGLYFLLRPHGARLQTVVLGILSFSGIAAIVFNLVTWGSPYEYLPLHLCSLTALVLPVVPVILIYLVIVYTKQIAVYFRKRSTVHNQ